MRSTGSSSDSGTADAGSPTRVVRVVSRANPLLLRMRRLAADPTAYRTSGELLLEGEHLCAAWADRGRPVARAVIGERVFAAEPRLRALAEKADAVAVVDDRVLAGASALESGAGLAYLVDLPATSAPRAGEPSIVLDGVQDPGNVGSVLRSAAAFGFGQVVALRGTAALWSPKVVRAAMGAHFSLALVEQVDDDALDALAVPLYGTSPRAAERLDAADLAWPCAWLLGSEGQGMRPALERRCTKLLRIEQPGGEESLNVAAAAAICGYESTRRRAAGRARKSG